MSNRFTTGKVYYGSALKAILAPPPRVSIIERATEYYWSHRWPAVALVAFGIVVAAGTVAAWIVA